MRPFIALIIIALAVLLQACSKSSPLEHEFNAKLGGITDESKNLYQVKRGLILIGRHKIKVTPVLEKETEAQGQMAAGIQFDITIDGQPRPDYVYGAVGIGATRDEARNSAFGQWYLGFGLPLFRFIAGNDPAAMVGGYAVYPGATGIRGDKPAGWLDDTATANTKIISHILPSLPQTDSIALDVKLLVPPSGELNGECRVNGVVSPDLTQKLKHLDWPRATSPYMFKQAFVLIKRKPL